MECRSLKLGGSVWDKANDIDRRDMLLIDYDEPGGYYPGPDFGCVHHTPCP